MKIQDAYTQWSEIYDTDDNKTRDLDHIVLKTILNKKKYGSILEIGCGTGKNTQWLCERAEKIIACDFSEGMLAKAQEKITADNVCFKKMDITQQWDIEKNLIDLIVCDLVLEHIKDLTHIFQQAQHVLKPHGIFFISELHPFRQYKGTQAHFITGDEKTDIPAFVHHISEFMNSASKQKLMLHHFNEWWHEQDIIENKPPRIVSFVFEKRL